MSLILEALRKSEAERRRGQVPDLHAERPPAAQLARGGRPAWLWLLALAIVAVIAMAWLARGQWTSTSFTADMQADPVGSAPTNNTVAVDADNGGAGSDGARGADAPAPIGAAAPPEPAPQPAEPAAPPARDTGSTATASIDEPALPTIVPTPSPTKPSAQPPAPATARPPSGATATDTTPLQLSALTATERRGLPPLKVSMHMWAPTAPGRFAIIDGARVNEGDRLGDAVVEEITRDGVILAWRGRRVQIPIH